MNVEKIYQQMLLIRMFEERLLELFDQGKLFGTTHTYIGQEAIAVSVIDHLKDGDAIFSGHRCHGHYLTRFGDAEGLLAEIMGREGGVCGGRGGSQHLCHKGFFSNGVQGGGVPIAAGMAFSKKRAGHGEIVVSFIGDGTLGEGTVYETLNLASLKQVPLLLIVENNRYAQTTPIEIGLAGNIAARAQAFGMANGEIESNDVHELHPRFEKIIEKMRGDGQPHLEVVHTYRLKAHSKGDDFRDASEIEAWAQRDPLSYLETKLAPAEKEKIIDEVKFLMAEAEENVERMPFGSLN